MALTNYSPDDILSEATELTDSYKAGGLNAHEYRLTLCQFRFRENGNTYWALDGRTQRWYCYKEGMWRSVDRVPARLEGPSWLVHVLLPEDAVTLPGILSQEPVDQSAAKVLSNVVEYIQSLYKQGRISSSDAEELLAQRNLVDNQGRFWAVGVRTLHWYYFDKGKWKAAEGLPTQDVLLRVNYSPLQCEVCGHPVAEDAKKCPKCGSLVTPRLEGASEQAYAAIYAFLISGAGTLPEAITEPWDPPAWFPEAIEDATVHCSVCDATNPSLSRYCNRCGTLLDKSTQEVPSLATKEATCPVCKATVKTGRKFCTSCGAALNITSEKAGGS